MFGFFRRWLERRAQKARMLAIKNANIAVAEAKRNRKNARRLAVA